MLTAKRRARGLLAFSSLIWLSAGSLGGEIPTLALQELEQREDEKGQKNSKNPAEVSPNAPTRIGTPALWADRGDVSALDLYWGIGGPERVPKLPFAFQKEVTSGTNPKVEVIDSAGVKWRIKFDEEVHSEIAASRIVWAAGYMVEEMYFVPSGKVEGAKGLGRAKKFVGADGAFTKARFERRPDNVVRREGNWWWDANPFFRTKELSGLAILNALLNNWDAKESNNHVLATFDADGTAVKEWYLVTDWGGTFGRMGGYFSRAKWDLDAFRKQAFIKGVSGGALKLHYHGQMTPTLKTIPLEHARWFAGIIGRLTDEQLRAAFKAAGASEAEIAGFATRLREKINELQACVGIDPLEMSRAAKGDGE